MSDQDDFWKSQQEQLQGALSEFEERASVPLVPGELESWLEEVKAAWQALWPQLQVQAQYIHAKEFAQIAEEDPELSCRVREMREEDTAIMAQSDEVADQLKYIETRLAQGTADPNLNEKKVRHDATEPKPNVTDFRDVGAMETELKDDVDQFVSLSLAVVSRIRKQEVAVRTWLVEAYTRDKGVMD
jgi:hypothetical protein